MLSSSVVRSSVDRLALVCKPRYFFLGEEGDKTAYVEDREGGRSALEEVDEALDLLRANIFQDSSGPIVGDGRGVMSSMAAMVGEEITEPGETEPAVECSHDRTLGMR